MLCWKLGEPKSGVTLEAAVVVAVVMVVVQRLAVPLVHAFGGLVRNTSDSARFFTWCITPEQNKSNKTPVLGVMHYCNQIFFPSDVNFRDNFFFNPATSTYFILWSNFYRTLL